ncbi:hypothetical protein ACFQU7_04385 [Pseudoroseomonas wenyumeiae]
MVYFLCWWTVLFAILPSASSPMPTARTRPAAGVARLVSPDRQ